MRKQIIAALLAALSTAPALAWNTLDGQPPLVIGHRGASGFLPEHTLQSYALAIEQGADFVEPDLVATKDGHLVARHEPLLSGTTNVADLPQFADRKTVRTIDGVSYNDWFASDFTLAEIKQLRARQARADRPQQFNDRFPIPTLEEIIALVKAKSAETGRSIGIYPETKHPTFHYSLGLPLEDRLVDVLAKAGWNRADAPVFIQSFESANLRYLHTITPVRLVQLIDADDVNPDGSLSLVPPYKQPYDFVVNGDPRTFADLLSPEGLAFVATYAYGIGPWKPYVLKTVIYDPNGDGVADDRNGDGVTDIHDRVVEGATDVIANAHAAGLRVHPYTFRNDASQYGFDNAVSEYATYYRIGVDGLFSDFPITAVRVRDSLGARH